MVSPDHSTKRKVAHLRARSIWTAVSLLLIVSLACNLPFSKKRIERPSVTATPATQPVQVEELPPTVVETLPLAGSTLPLQGGIELAFDQPMERGSVEGAIQLEPAYSGRFEWQDDSRVKFISDQPLPPETPLTVRVSATARAKNGLALLRQQEFAYQTAGRLRIAERIPAENLAGVDPQMTVAVTFNQPVVSLGGDETDLPEGFSLDPPVEGSGRWLNTSTYVFQPEPSLGGGVTYTVSVNPDLISLAGSPLDKGEQLTWSFTTDTPQILWVNPGPGETIWLDSDFTVGFNQPMDRASIQEHLLLLDDQGNPLSGSYTWRDQDTRVIFQPKPLLERDSQYRLMIGAECRSRGGTALSQDTVYSFQTIDRLAVIETTPDPGSGIATYGGHGSIILEFNAPLTREQNLEELISVEPVPVDFNISLSGGEYTLYLPGFYESNQSYRLTISADLKDRWGGRLNEPFIRSFRVSDLEPQLTIPMVWAAGQVIYSLPGERSLQAIAANLSSLTVQFAPVSVEQMWRDYHLPSDVREIQPEQTWTQPLSMRRNDSQTIEIGLTPDGSNLAPGLYHYRISSPQIDSRNADIDFWLVVSQVQLNLKASKDEVFVWAADGDNLSVVPGKSVSVYDADFKFTGAAVTDASGIARIQQPGNSYQRGNILAVIGQPGDEDFSAGFSFWDEGIQPWDFRLEFDSFPPDLFTYLYTDRPIYRPGQTVYFRGVLRTPANARYTLPAIKNVEIEVYGEYNPETEVTPLITTLQRSVSAYGTIDGEFILPIDSRPGTYSMMIKDNSHSLVTFQVAEYRKPEIDLEVSFDQDEYSRGEDLRAEIEAKYFFGVEAGGASVSWSLYARDQYYSLPGGYTTGPLDESWLRAWWYPGLGISLGYYLSSGEGKTAADGKLPLTFTGRQIEDLLETRGPVTLTLEATLTDESGLPVSRRAAVTLHPADFYVGVRSDSWGGEAGEPLGFSIQTADWQKQPSGLHSLTASFQKVVWKQDLISLEVGGAKYTKEATLIASVNFRTDTSGRARLEFTPPEPGTYELEISGGGALTQILIWVGGAGSAQWPRLPHQHLRMETDRSDYQPGETAQIFIPNPFAEGALGLVTVERDGVMRSQVIEIEGASHILELELDAGDAPNVYVSVLLLGSQDGRLDFRQGYVELNIAGDFLELQVELHPEQELLEPGQTARAEIVVSDSQGRPVQGEFSLAVVDAAIYALAEPNTPDIREAFYGKQPLQVRSSAALAAYHARIPLSPPALGGGGGEGVRVPELRESFRDTAFWRADIETDARGRATISFPVPDNLTTWVMTVRGLDKSSRVGETSANIVVSKDLLIRPVTPRFLVAGDRVQLGAVVHNNTGQPFEVTVDLLAKGVQLDDPGQSAQKVQVAARSSQRVDWWVNVQSAAQAELVFSAAGGGYQDASTPEQGALPIHRYTTPAAFATSGVLAQGGERLEVVSLPRSFTPTGGELSIELSSTLAGTVLSGLKAMEDFPYDFSEAVISRLYANLAVYNLLRDVKVDSPDLETQLKTEIRSGMEHLTRLQNADGGWGWAGGQDSLLYLSAYALLAISGASDAGFLVNAERLSKAQEYVASGLYPADMKHEDYELDRLTLANYALYRSGVPPRGLEDLYQSRDRLSPWGKALLAMTLSGSDAARTGVLLADLQASAVRSETGAYWQDAGGKWFNHASPLASTAMVVYALAEKDPASALLSEAVRYLSLHRRVNGGWDSTYDSAWCILALARVLRATGDLQGSFTYSATVNRAPLASGKAAGAATLNVVRGSVDLQGLSLERGNALRIQREAGPGRLYYRAYLQLDMPVENARALDKGITVERRYTLLSGDCLPQDCPRLSEVQLAQPAPVILAQVSITLQNDLYNLVVEDFIPAGAEIVNTRLQTSRLGAPQFTGVTMNPFDMFSDGWGWWYFSSPVVYDDHIRWVSDYLPAGTYILTYRLQPLQAGEFRVMPAHAYAYYFPEVEGRSAGEIFKISEE